MVLLVRDTRQHARWQLGSSLGSNTIPWVCNLPAPMEELADATLQVKNPQDSWQVSGLDYAAALTRHQLRISNPQFFQGLGLGRLTDLILHVTIRLIRVLLPPPFSPLVPCYAAYGLAAKRRLS